MNTVKRLENPGCPIEDVEGCAVRNSRRWDWTLPSFLAVLSILGVWFGSFVGYIIINDRRATRSEGKIELLQFADRSILEHMAFTEAATLVYRADGKARAAADHAETREDIKEVKRLLLQGRGR